MTSKIAGLVALWFLLITLSVVAPRLVGATGEGFMRGANRLPLVFALQGAALAVAVATAALSYQSRAAVAGWRVAVGMVPLLLTVGGIALLLLFLSQG